MSLSGFRTKPILIYDVDFVKGYDIFQYHSGFQLCSMLDKSWKLPQMQKMAYFYSFFFFFFFEGLESIGQQVWLIPNS